MDYSDLKKEIEKLLDAGDEQRLREYLTEHFEDLPEEVQGKVLLAFYSEAIEKQAGDVAIEKIQKEGMEAMTKISALKAVLSLPPQSA